jgi:peptide chain release factor subunit 1
LARVRDEHERHAVVVLDKQRARLFVAQLGQVAEVADILEDIPKHHKQGGRSQMRLQRHHDAHVMWHAGAVAHATFLLMERFEAKHLFVSGSAQILAEYRVHLAPKLVRRWKGEFTVSIDAKAEDVARAIADVEGRTEAEAEAAAIARVNDAVPTGRGVWGLGKTLSAVEERRVQLLVVHDRYRAPGRECLACAILLPEGGDSCPACGGTSAAVEDVVDAILEHAVTQEAELELVRADGSRRLLPPGEPIGALLRF